MPIFRERPYVTFFDAYVQASNLTDVVKPRVEPLHLLMTVNLSSTAYITSKQITTSSEESGASPLCSTPL
ncbi:hypothetical protein PMIT1342_00557 [Prochlorococcus marinus str. MIT 1342]|uniref:hypothetical protein n=1 Tax=Prochlorococcus TaxID=1218 RepID=UPI0007B38D4D|nr:hypothetical protein [Prochlorococcus marinus]KZR82906.1 hypothetical protein PMIT1342_00557 [Prochlorococcus marinus str. MIT 1342]